MRIVFFGSSKYSKIIEKALYQSFGLSLVVTVPDQPIGRKKEIIPSPVKQFAIDHHIPVIAIDTITEKIIEKIKAVSPDFLIVSDFRLILPHELLSLPTYGALNVHQSLLPKYRGPSPAPSAILAGEKETGVSIMMITDTVDA